MKRFCKNYFSYYWKLLIYLACGFILSMVLPAAATQENLLDQLNNCASIKLSHERLDCYDSISQTHIKPQKISYIKPPQNFLASKIRTDRHIDEYRITVSDLVTLLKMATLGNQNNITLQGWVRQHNTYTLHMTMREKMSISFSHFNSKSENISVLSPVKMNGEKIDASLFIITIAAMTPDE